MQCETYRAPRGALAPALLSGIRVSAERIRDIGDGSLCTDAVPGVVQRRRHDGNTELARGNGDDSAADAALCRQTGAVEPFAGIVIEAGRRHHGENTRDL